MISGRLPTALEASRAQIPDAARERISEHSSKLDCSRPPRRRSLPRLPAELGLTRGQRLRQPQQVRAHATEELRDRLGPVVSACRNAVKACGAGIVILRRSAICCSRTFDTVGARNSAPVL